MRIPFKHQGQADHYLKTCRKVLDERVQLREGMRLPTHRVRNAFCRGFGYQSYNDLSKCLARGTSSFVQPSVDDLGMALEAGFDRALGIAHELGIKSIQLGNTPADLATVALVELLPPECFEPYHHPVAGPKDSAPQLPMLPHLVLSPEQDREYEQAAPADAIMAGYNDDLQPVYWTEQQRSGQTCLSGISGSGKSSFLKDVFRQDVAAGRAVIYFDGKSDQSLVRELIEIAGKAGRAGDVRLIDPSRPEVSCGFNAITNADGKLEERVTAAFDSLNAAHASDEFFAEHQRGYLHAVAQILGYTRKSFTFLDILLLCQDPAQMGRVLEEGRARMDSDPSTVDKDRWHFNLMAEILAGAWREKDWRAKIRGLLNSLLPFISGPLAILTGGGTGQVTFEEAAERNLILVVSLNLGADRQVQRSLGRILLRNLQLMIVSRYNDYGLAKHPFLSVLLDEFNPSVYGDFKNIVHTGRQANAAFIFAFQSVSQLIYEAGEDFARSLMGGVANQFIGRTNDVEPVERFLAMAAGDLDDFGVRKLAIGQLAARMPNFQAGGDVALQRLHTRRPARPSDGN